ncbi:MAG: single-stranded-DNA-specific exonuclease RecJ [Betaproteobacteria bacterium]|nr:single-stranded-DNA-specific exonuclease RecJ [Betaproteobacteria bacterium]
MSTPDRLTTATRLTSRKRDVDPAVSAALTQAGVHPVMARLLAARAVRSADEITTDLDGLLPPDRMLNLTYAAEMLARAILEGEKLLVVADFDADGATACAIAIRGLRRFGAKVDFLVPDRFAFGYGLTAALVDHAAALHRQELPHWIITVDNGISSIAGVNRATELNINVLVTDHHLPGPTLPKALIVNPNQPGCPFPSKNLAGVGVMFYLLMALRANFRVQHQWPAEKLPRLDDLLPIVALGTVADLVKLDANNRRLVAQGLKRLRRGNTFAGLNALFEVANRSTRDASVRDLGFAIGPRINAAGRLSDMAIGIRCLIEDDPEQARELATTLDQLNRERQEIEFEARESALKLAHDKLSAIGIHTTGDERSSPLGIVLHDAQWHQGVIGLVAGRLKDTFYRPTIIFASDSDSMLLKGSCRSIPGIHIRDVLERIDSRHPGLLKAFGGHAMAAGLTLAAEDLTQFSQAFEEALQAFADPADLQQVLEFDGELKTEEFRLDLAQLLSRQIWGQGFPEPIFINEFEVLAQRLIKDQHLRLTLRPADHRTAPGPTVEAIWFRASGPCGPRSRLAYRLGINDWQGRSSLQLEIVGLA